MPCSKRPGGDVHCARSACTKPDAMHGWGEQVGDCRNVGEATKNERLLTWWWGVRHEQGDHPELAAA